MLIKLFNKKIALEAFLNIMLSVSLFLFVRTQEYLNYISPKMEYYMYFASLVFMIWGIVVLKDLFKPSSGVSSFTYLILFIPILLVLTTRNVDNKTYQNNRYVDIYDAQGMNPYETYIGEESSISTEHASNRISINERSYTQLGEIGIDEENEKIVIQDADFFNVFKEVFANPKKFEGFNIDIKGFVYQKSNDNNEFILGREMILCCLADLATIGINCEYENPDNIINDTWLDLSGTIETKEIEGELKPYIKIANTKVSEMAGAYIYPF